MSTDGVKIIDGDLAFDIYSSFMNLYDENASTEELLQRYEEDKQLCSNDEEDYEVCVTAYALAFWEIGELNQHLIKGVKDVIDKKASVKGWALDAGEKMAEKREKELEKFWLKINTPRKKLRKRKKYRKITDFLFQKGDIFTFQDTHGMYGISVVTNIYHEKGVCTYVFGCSTYMSEKVPEMEAIEEIEFIGMLQSIAQSAFLVELGLKHNDVGKNFHLIKKIGQVKLKDNVSLGYAEGLSYKEVCAKLPFDQSIEKDFNGRRSLLKFKLREFITD